MGISKVAKEMLRFIEEYPKTKATQWPTKEEVEQWRMTVEGHRAMEKLTKEEFDDVLREG